MSVTHSDEGFSEIEFHIVHCKKRGGKKVLDKMTGTFQAYPGEAADVYV